MRPGVLSRALLLGCAITMALTGCGVLPGGSDDEAGGDGGPPAGGWPQPEGGKVTVKMCGLLTEADYRKFGHDRLPSVSEKVNENGPNTVDCLYMTSDALSLNLQPSADSAKLVYTRWLDNHKDRMESEEKDTILAEGVVTGADESWFDYETLGSQGGEFQEHELWFRRGSLVGSLQLSGLKGDKEQPPKDVLSGLAKLVLERIPDVGKTDTGKAHTVKYEVRGTGKADISYSDPNRVKSVELKDQALPWTVEVPMAWYGKNEAPLMVNASTKDVRAGRVSCIVSVDEVQVTEQPMGFLAFCQGNYKHPVG